MRRSVQAILVVLALMAAACAARKPPKLPPFEAHAATLGITRGIKVAAFAQLPDGFIPAAGVPPMWLRQGLEVGVVGTANGQSTILGLSGPGLIHGRVLAADGGPAAPGGKLVDAAPNHDGTLLATMVAESAAPRLNVYLRTMNDGDDGHVIASFDGIYDRATLAWLGKHILTIALHAGAQPSPASSETAPENETMAVPANGIYVMDVAAPQTLMHLDGVDCPVARLTVAPDARLAVSEGDNGVPPAIFDLKGHTCRSLGLATPIKPLEWATDASSFLFAAPGPGGAVGVFRYVIASAAISTIAISSKSAAIASDGTIVAIGNRELTWQLAASDPNHSIKTEVALINPASGEIKMNPLGYNTTPLLLAESSITYTQSADYAAIDALMPGPDGPQRQLIEYAARSRSAFVFGRGPADQPIGMSWSPNGAVLAAVTVGPSSSVITVFIPPQ
ncbi:MAG TPA: hypothetical protein VHY56_13770 [Candidatus Binataceae bacterium]|nr:hypothetical protein [Candidatus Binataceae bacterium]